MEESLEELQKLRGKVLDKVSEKTRKNVKLHCNANPKQTVAAIPRLAQGKLGSHHRLFVVSAELLDEHEGSQSTPWASAPGNKNLVDLLGQRLDLVLEMAKEPWDFIVVSDGANKSLRQTIQNKLGNVSELLVLYEETSRFQDYSKRGQWQSLYLCNPKGAKDAQINLVPREAA